MSTPDPPNDSLRDVLDALLRSGSTANPALHRLLDDYMRYHVVFVVVGGLSMLGLLLLSALSWKQFRRAPHHDDGRWTFAKRTHFSFAAASAAAGLLMAVIVVANVSNVLDPRQGLIRSTGLLDAPHDGRVERLHRAFEAWLQSGSAKVPPVVQRAIDDRLAWQQPKAIVCGSLLVVFAVGSVRIWRSLLTLRASAARWRSKEAALLVSGVVAVLACSLLVLMVIGNSQGSLAPITLTLLFG